MNQAARKQYKRWAGRFDNLSLRERLFVLVAALVILQMLWTQWVWDPLTDQQLRLDRAIGDNTSGIKLLDVELQGLVTRAQKDPDVQIRRQIAGADEQLQRLDREIRDAASSLISPRQMATLLEELLVRDQVLRLVKLQNLEPQPLVLPKKSETEASDAIEGPLPNIYKHGFVIEFEGDYLSTRDYLKTLEALPWKFFWDAIRFEVQEYPRARVRLELHTMSLNPRWLGV